ncbi:VanZ family protein [Paenibacillus paeoniae]|uniref:VanZ family protein n=1 Tax=Paenibacillus paeoniae TaxID=2292705 RepID=A0A371P0L8_9BACL|nr:VanZ family protein [Paenibacillus paeoniae]REK69479.1 VanZ family protein [Paenibacillus paeoniae]
MIDVKLYRKAFSRHTGFNVTVTLLALLYALIMLNLLFLRNRFMMDGYAYNLIPFDTIKHYVVYRDHFNFDTWFKNLFGNLVLFIPIGMFLPLLNTRFRSSLMLIAATVIIIGIIETAQMLLRVGSFDIDDIILNTAGAWIGLMLTRSFMRREKR